MIGIIGLFLGYVCILSLFPLSYLLRPIPSLSEKVRILGENFLCYIIRLLLHLQPWLNCRVNFPPIHQVYKKIGTRKVIFISNHRSNLDTFLLISYIPGLRGIAKKSLFYNVFFAPAMWIIGFIPVEKGSLNSFLSGLDLIRKKILGQNRALLVFPETTRCPKNMIGLQKFSSAIFQLALDTQSVIVPLAITGSDQAYGRGDLFLTSNQPIQIEMLEPVLPEKYTNADSLKNHVWNVIHQELV